MTDQMYFDILVLIIAAIIAFLNEIRETRTANILNPSQITRFGFTLRMLILCLLVFSIFSRISQFNNSMNEAEIRNAQYDSLLRRVDTSLIRHDSTLRVTNDILRNTGVTVSNLNHLNEVSKNTTDSLAIVLKGTKEIFRTTGLISNAQQEALFESKELINGLNILTAFTLLHQEVAQSLRIVVSFKDPVTKQYFTGKKYYSQQEKVELNTEIGREMSLRGNVFFMNGKSFANMDNEYLSFRLFVENFTDHTASVSEPFGDILSTLPNNTRIYYYKDDGEFCFALEFEKGLKNMAKLYEDLKQLKSEVSITKNYASTITKLQVEENERKFLDQGVTYFLEMPINEEKDISFKLPLELVKVDITEKQKNSPKPFYSIKYTWKPVTSLEKIIIDLD